MKVISLNMNNTVLRGSMQDAYKCLREGFRVLEAASAMIDSLNIPSEDSEISAGEYLSIQLINAETLLDSLSTPAIDMYHTGSLSRSPLLFDRLTVFMAVRDQLVPILIQIVDAYVDMTTEEQKAVGELTRKILEQLSFFIFFEFNFDTTSTSIQNNEELEVNEAVLEYTGREQLNLNGKILMILDLYVKYRPTIPSFDFDEETIDMFYYHAGFSALTILDNIDSLQPEIVKKLAAGEISADDVVALIAPDKVTEFMKIFD